MEAGHMYLCGDLPRKREDASRPRMAVRTELGPSPSRGPSDMALSLNIGGLPVELLLDPQQPWEWNIALTVGGLGCQ